ncbi:MAG: aldo/keto reductase, partial [Bacteroidales bacterium]|nr:aldo/keto reductase [Bacteroidales bacterium]
QSEKGQFIYGWREAFNVLCGTHGVNPGDACLHFGLSHPAIVSIALNTSKPEKMNRNVEILQREIPASFWEAIREAGLIDPEYRYV